MIVESELRRSTTLILRPMSDNDVTAVLALDEVSHLTPWSEGNFRDALAAGNLCLVGERDSTLVGCAVLQMVAGEAEVLTLAVAPDARRSGVGRELLRAMIDRADAYGAASMWLEVRKSNRAAIGLYRDAGFAEIGARKGYYQDGDAREDAVTMRLELASNNEKRSIP